MRRDDEAVADLFDYIEVFYNRSRRHSTLGYCVAGSVLAELDHDVSMSGRSAA